MHPLEALMRVMTHLNIGAAIAMLAWVFWSGIQIVGGQSVLPAGHTPTKQASTPPSIQSTPMPASSTQASAPGGRP